MKNYILSISIIFTLFLSAPQYIEAVTNTGFIPGQIWYSKEILVEGETVNIHTAVWNGEKESFMFKVEFYDKNRNHQGSDNVFVKYPQVSGQTIKTYIPVREFECSNSMMYNDFQELLKASEYPYITIEIDPSQVRNILPGKSSTDLIFSITIASITNAQYISCDINTYPNSTMSITGEATIQLANFQIKPPIKFMGLVKVKDEVTIKFSFNFIVI